VKILLEINAFEILELFAYPILNGRNANYLQNGSGTISGKARNLICIDVAIPLSLSLCSSSLLWKVTNSCQQGKQPMG